MRIPALAVTVTAMLALTGCATGATSADTSYPDVDALTTAVYTATGHACTNPSVHTGDSYSYDGLTDCGAFDAGIAEPGSGTFARWRDGRCPHRQVITGPNWVLTVNTDTLGALTADQVAALGGHQYTCPQ